MRVIAGTLRGRRLRAPGGEGTRPTADRVREALFSMLGEAVLQARVLDLFAGSGALGIEALSRGASRVTFVDRAPTAIAAVRANLADLGLRAEVRRSEALAFVGAAIRAGHQYDLVFVDPPYAQAASLGQQLSTTLPGLLAPGARVVAESDRRAPLGLGLPVLRERRYGDTLITIHDATE
jgi:16S rRNA (guanine966-N2)-methyltransferase